MIKISQEIRKEIYQKWRFGKTHKELATEYNLGYWQIQNIIDTQFKLNKKV